jgi:hypothetical protein
MKQIFVTLVMAFVVPFFSYYRLKRQGNNKPATFNLFDFRQKGRFNSEKE